MTHHHNASGNPRDPRTPGVREFQTTAENLATAVAQGLSTSTMGNPPVQLMEFVGPVSRAEDGTTIQMDPGQPVASFQVETTTGRNFTIVVMDDDPYM